MKGIRFTFWLSRMLRDQRGAIGADIGTAQPEGTESAGAATQTATAEGQSAEGTDTGTASGEVDTTASGAAESGTEDTSKDRGAHQTTAAERQEQLKGEIHDLASTREKIKKEVLEEINATVRESVAKMQSPEKPFQDLDMEKVNTAFAAVFEKIEDLRMEGSYVEAAKLQRKLYAAIDELETNEQKRQEWEKQQQSGVEQQRFNQMINMSIAETEPLLKKQMGIPDEAWNEGKKFFEKVRQEDPLLDRKYRDLVMHQGPAFALEFAANYVKENMGKEAREEQERRDQAKAKLPPGPSGAAPVETIGIERQLADARKKASETGAAHDLAEVSRLNRELKTAKGAQAA